MMSPEERTYGGSRAEYWTGVLGDRAENGVPMMAAEWALLEALAHIRELRAERPSSEELASLKAALKECADELEQYVEAEYVETKDYPSQRRRYERDMGPVHRARAALSAKERTAGGERR